MVRPPHPGQDVDMEQEALEEELRERFFQDMEAKRLEEEELSIQVAEEELEEKERAFFEAMKERFLDGEDKEWFDYSAGLLHFPQPLCLHVSGMSSLLSAPPCVWWVLRSGHQ